VIGAPCSSGLAGNLLFDKPSAIGRHQVNIYVESTDVIDLLDKFVKLLLLLARVRG
jgi:hypothetical protein